MRVKFKPFPPLASFCLGMLISIGILLFLTILYVNKDVRGKNLRYVESVSQLAAKHALEAVFNADLIKLQILTQHLHEQTDISIATVYDVEYNLLAQSAEQNLSPKMLITYVTPIVLDDTIAGYISVSMKKSQPFGVLWFFFTVFACLLLCSVTAWSLLRHQAIELIKEPIKKNEKMAHSDTGTHTENKIVAAAPKDDHYIFAIITIKNFEVTKQQLSGENFRKVIAKFENILSDVSVIYGGAYYFSEGPCYNLGIPLDISQSETKIDDIIFKAICSAYLVLELGGIVNKIPLDLSALVSDKHTDKQSLQPVPGLHIEEHLAKHEHLLHRLQLLDVDEAGTQNIVAGFKEPFHTLLENQRKQLAQIHQNS